MMLKLDLNLGKLVMILVAAIAIFLYAGSAFAGNHNNHSGATLRHDSSANYTHGYSTYDQTDRGKTHHKSFSSNNNRKHDRYYGRHGYSKDGNHDYSKYHR
jgi:hypothetical protein